MTDQFASAEWLKPLFKKLQAIRKEREKELAAIGDVFGDPLELAQFYVEPECQQHNPADFDEDEATSVVRSPVFKTVNSFLAGAFAVRDGRQQLFVLSDAGMGKTSLLVMLKLGHLTAFWPQGHDCALFKLGPDTLQKLEKLENKANTVLLLDSLDEDPTAFGRSEGRLREILEATQNFRRVIISCRTQFFPEHGVTPFKTPGKVVVAGFSCPMIFLSLFNDAHVDEYLKKRFSQGVLEKLLGRMPEKHGRASALVGKMKSLRFRPLLLAHIEDLVDSELPSLDDYAIYEALVKAWLLREERTLKQTHPKNAPSSDELLEACSLLAYRLWRDRLPSATQDWIRALIADHPRVAHLRDFDFGGRSLLNRNSDGAYRFSHFSVQEYLVVRAALAATEVDRSMTATAQMLRFLQSWVDEGRPTGLDWSDSDAVGPLWLAIQEARYLRRAHGDVATAWFAQPGRSPKKRSLLGFRLEQVTEKGNVELIWIPGGTFRMGSPEAQADRLEDEGPQHEVTVSSFYLGRYPVTNAQYGAFLAANPGITKPSDWEGALDRRPVVGVSWDEAQRFAKWAGARLPTEAEWEYACRAGTTDSRYGELDEIAWHRGNSDGHTQSVGQKRANPFGLHDMLGNVWEWCSDWYGAYPHKAQTDPPGPRKGAGRVVRGGSWNVRGRYARSAQRLVSVSSNCYRYLGFRLARGRTQSGG